MSDDATAAALASLNQTIRKLVEELHELNELARLLSETQHVGGKSS